MKRYYITTWNYDNEQMTHEYGFIQWLELISAFKATNRKFKAFTKYDYE